MAPSSGQVMVPKKKRQVSWVPSAAARHLLAHVSGGGGDGGRTGGHGHSGGCGGGGLGGCGGCGGVVGGGEGSGGSGLGGGGGEGSGEAGGGGEGGGGDGADTMTATALTGSDSWTPLTIDSATALCTAVRLATEAAICTVVVSPSDLSLTSAADAYVRLRALRIRSISSCTGSVSPPSPSARRRLTR